MKALHISYSIFTGLLIFSSINSEEGDPYRLINKVKTECEYRAFTYGTKLADYFNSLDEATDKDFRLHQDYLVEHLGFAPWLQKGVSGNSGKTTNQKSAVITQKERGWIGITELAESAYWALEDKWVYMVGDATMKQIFTTFLSPLQATETKYDEKWTSANCQKQAHRVEGEYPDEKNEEVTCHQPGFGSNGKISYDWKHMVLEDYDRWLFGEEGLFKSNSQERSPDILVLQLGLHSCIHAFPDANTKNEELLRLQQQQIPEFFSLLSTALKRLGNTPRGVEVVMMTSGRQLKKDPRTDVCVWRTNRMVAYEAHRQGFLVLEREEIEHRLLFKSEQVAGRPFLQPQMLLDTPAPEIVASALLKALSCIGLNGTVSESVAKNMDF